MIPITENVVLVDELKEGFTMHIIFGAIFGFLLTAFGFITYLGIQMPRLSTEILSGLIGAVFGGLASIIGSHIGGIRGAKQSFELSMQSNKKIAKEILYRQLEFTHFELTSWLKKQDVENKTYTPLNKYILIYDREWFKHMALVDSLTQEEQDYIVLWFNSLSILETFAARNNGTIHGEVLVNIWNEECADGVIKVLKKLSGKY